MYASQVAVDCQLSVGAELHYQPCMTFILRRLLTSLNQGTQIVHEFRSGHLSWPSYLCGLCYCINRKKKDYLGSWTLLRKLWICAFMNSNFSINLDFVIHSIRILSTCSTFYYIWFQDLSFSLLPMLVQNYILAFCLIGWNFIFPKSHNTDRLHITTLILISR